MNTEILTQIGLSKNEIKVYFALLELDQSSATPIIRKAGIPNSKVYPILEKLIKKGLVSYVIKSNVKHFQASDPKHLIELLNTKQKQISQQKQEIEKLVPQIELKRKLAKEKQEASVYEGIKGVKAALDNILNMLKKGEEYSVFTLGEELGEKEIIRILQKHHQKRIEKGVEIKLISNSNLKPAITKNYSKSRLNIRYTNLKLPTGIFIFKNNVMTLVWGETPTAFVIHSKNNAQTYKKFFEEMWKTSTK
ncbi:MAG: helix-turn-helix domain-containing protein [Candidatus Woesearchaeota archaeon]